MANPLHGLVDVAPFVTAYHIVRLIFGSWLFVALLASWSIWWLGITGTWQAHSLIHGLMVIALVGSYWLARRQRIIDLDLDLPQIQNPLFAATVLSGGCHMLNGAFGEHLNDELNTIMIIGVLLFISILMISTFIFRIVRMGGLGGVSGSVQGLLFLSVFTGLGTLFFVHGTIYSLGTTHGIWFGAWGTLVSFVLTILLAQFAFNKHEDERASPG